MDTCLEDKIVSEQLFFIREITRCHVIEDFFTSDPMHLLTYVTTEI